MDFETEIFIDVVRHDSVCYTKAIRGFKRQAAKNGSGGFPCKNFACSRKCTDSIKSGEMHEGFPFFIGDLIGQGGFSKVFEGKFHEVDVAFKFIPIPSDHKPSFKSRGCYEYWCQEHITKVVQKKFFKLQRKTRS